MNIQKISLRDVVFSGRHGTSSQEQETAQRFQVDVTLSFDAQPSIVSEKLEDTIDYFDVIKLIRAHIENVHRSHILLETLVDDIAMEIALQFPCVTLDLHIQKLDVPFRPRIGVSRNYFSGKCVPMKSFQEIHQDLIIKGAASIPFLTDNERESLLAQAQLLDYVRQPDVAAGGLVREDLSSCSVSSEASPFSVVADRVALFIQEMTHVTGQSSERLPRAHVALQKYEAGSFGITPHRDEKKYGMLICIIPLVGKGTLATCDDRAGSNPQAVDTTPGNLVMLRAPGYANMHVRPMHTVTDITEERIVLGIRFPTNGH